IPNIFFIETTFITNPTGTTIIRILDFTPFIFTGSNPENLISPHPELYLSTTFAAIAMGIHWFGKPNAVFETESFIGQGTHRTNIDHIADEIIVKGLFNIGCNFSMVSTIQYSMDAFVR